MSPANDHSTVDNEARAIAQRRRRIADQIGNQLYNAALYGYFVPTDALTDVYPHLNTNPLLQEVLRQAPRVAADPSAVRVARTARGSVIVLRLHGPRWSLVMTGGLPVPTYLLVVHDAYTDGTGPAVMSLLDIQWAPELETMCRGIHAAVADQP